MTNLISKSVDAVITAQYTNCAKGIINPKRIGSITAINIIHCIAPLGLLRTICEPSALEDVNFNFRTCHFSNRIKAKIININKADKYTAVFGSPRKKHELKITID